MCLDIVTGILFVDILLCEGGVIVTELANGSENYLF